MTNYDRIADLYDVDMARNMPFDDVAFYAGQVRRGDAALELGCGNGRILLGLRRRGIDVVGVDLSMRMLQSLQRKARAEGLSVPLAHMDVRALGLARAFDCVLCPYSLVTYLVDDRDVGRMLEDVRAVLRPGGRLVIDAFVPRPLAVTGTYTEDYRRPYAEGLLVRWKRITPIDAERNRIERRYERHDASGVLQEVIEVSEIVRPVSAQKLGEMLREHAFAVTREAWDYGAPVGDAAPQFYAAVAEPA